jgi:hypothetical protein
MDNILNSMIVIEKDLSQIDEHLYNLFWRVRCRVKITHSKEIMKYLFYALKFEHKDIIDSIINCIHPLLTRSVLRLLVSEILNSGNQIYLIRFSEYFPEEYLKTLVTNEQSDVIVMGDVFHIKQ